MEHLRKVLIVGGGSAGWMTAALFAKLLNGIYDVTLVESEEIGTIGVGEATIPAIKKYNALLELSEDDFLRRTNGTFKLGIQFNDWLRLGSSYIHGFGVIGQDLGWLRCHQYWLKMQGLGKASDFANYSINTAAALSNKFMRSAPELKESPLAHIAHAFHFDAGLYARYLRGFSEARGIKRVEGKIGEVKLRPEDGFVESVVLQNGETLAADLFIDCSGMRAIVIEGALQTGYENWSHWLPCDRAVAVGCQRSENFTPYTKSTALAAGWQWRIPLQHRTGNGHVYSSQYMDADEAERILLANLDGSPTNDPLHIRFETGKRKKIWNKNCVAIGLSSGFLEPLESTSLHLIQSAIIRLLRFLPDQSFDPATIAEFNRQTDYEYERIRDFIILHYKATERGDSEFWRYCRGMSVPATLQRKMDLFAGSGRIFREDEELFSEESWIQVCIGQGIMPKAYDPMVDIRSEAEIEAYLNNIEAVVRKCVAVMPTHAEFVERNCLAPA
ncbi:MAG TPA: tryptophan 7-halogenase [Hyphomonas sp.]|nr:MAG: tryptophan halogenase [Hyphomonadaceae bacterium BRH_c29]HAY06426.1 tryptophan 7-halogenase [Hyphomonas sp.]HRI99219.1 tryptophan 7-halogenase [Hyphomonas sp.]HRK66320.1 tryptophan 7-halogenase [Hyphomonas sp.]